MVLSRHTNNNLKTCVMTILAVIVLYMVYRYHSHQNYVSLPVNLHNGIDERPGVNHTVQHSIVDVLRAADVGVYSYDPDKAWVTSGTCRTIDSKTNKEDFVRLPLMSPVGKLHIYVHDPKRDGISSRVYKSGQFEPALLNNILLFLRTDDDVNFIDVGANIGLHTLPILKFGRKVIALEAEKSNVGHICASAHDLGNHRNLRVIHNAVGSDHKPSMFYLGRNGRFGGNFVDVGVDTKIKQNKFRLEGSSIYQTKPVPIPTVTLDDLLSMPNQEFFKEFGTNFMKVDVEGSEFKVLEGAKKLLQKTKNIGVIMEWRWHQGQPSAKVMVDIFKSLGYEAYNPESRNRKYKTKQPTMAELKDVFQQKLDYSSTSHWPHDVVWIPKKL